MTKFKQRRLLRCVELLSAAEMTRAIAKSQLLNISTLLLINKMRSRFLVDRCVITTSTKLLQIDDLAWSGSLSIVQQEGRNDAY